MKFLAFLIILLSNELYALNKDTYFNHNLTQTTGEKTYDYNLKTISKIEKEVEVSVSEYNEENFINYMFGVEREEFEEPNSFYRQSLSPSFSFRFNKKMFLWLENKYNFNITKNNLILKQEFLFNFFRKSNFNIKPVFQLGQKIAVSEQKNSGYFFSNIGGNFSFKYKKIILDITYLRNFSSFEYDSTTTEILYEIRENNYIGLYFGLENYIPFNLENEREGQQNLRGGLIYYY